MWWGADFAPVVEQCVSNFLWSDGGNDAVGDELMKPRMWKDHPWYNCGEVTGGQCEGVWCCHKPTDCKGTAHPKGSAPTKRKVSFASDERKLKLVKALGSIVDDKDDESEASE